MLLRKIIQVLGRRTDMGFILDFAEIASGDNSRRDMKMSFGGMTPCNLIGVIRRLSVN
jgi:hypothetical protein